MSEQVLTGVTYWSRDLGPYLWHEFDPERTRHDLRTMANARVHVVRTLLPWDVFMPAVARPDAGALRNLETLLSAAEQLDMRVIPVLFAQALGDCVALPTYAIDVDAPRPGVRVLSGGVVQPGGPRDQYTDPRMLEAQLRWLEGMLGAFAGNATVAMWDLGHDPAAVMRPRRIEHLRSWCASMALPLHEAGEHVALTLGAGDVTTARGVRLDAVASTLDAVGIAVDPLTLEFARGGAGARPVAFLTQLAIALAGGDRALHVHLGIARGEEPDAGTLQRLTRDAVDRLVTVGCGAVYAAAWSDCAARVLRVPPFDVRPELARCGLVDTDGSPTAVGGAWLEVTSSLAGVQPRAAWPRTLDSADYYANLPHSIDDLYSAWQAEVDD